MTASHDQIMSRALAAHRAGKLAEAADLYQSALRSNPQDAEALHLLGVVLDTQGECQRAAALIESALALHESVSYRCNHAMVLGHLGRHEEAVAAAQRALALRPDYPEALNNLGVSLAALGRTTEAIAAYRDAVSARPGYGAAWTNLGHALRNAGRFEEAIAAHEQALSLNPAQGNDPEALNSLAIVLACLRRLDEAESAGRKAIALRPDFAQAHANLGDILRRLDRHEEAESVLRRAIALRPGDGGAYRNLAIVLDEQDRPHEALAVLDLAIALQPDDADAHHHRAMLLLRQGRFVQGWAEYDWRFKIGQAGGAFRTDTAQAPWNGQPLGGRSILLTPEQGLGDTIQFCRYAPLVAARGGRVLLGAPRPLARLLRNSLPGVQVIAEGEAVPEHALRCPLLSLPHAFGTTPETVPASVPYLAPPHDALVRWRKRLSPAGGLRAGIVWAGNPNHLNDRRRSLAFSELAPLWEIDGLHWSSLQVGPRAADLADAPFGRIKDLAPELTDFAETAAAISQLDIVVTPDTAIAHLAGALGARTLVMLPFAADWRWIRGQDTSPWYPTMRLIRQDGRRSWKPVIDRVATALETRVREAGTVVRDQSRSSMRMGNVRIRLPVA